MFVYPRLIPTMSIIGFAFFFVGQNATTGNLPNSKLRRQVDELSNQQEFQLRYLEPKKEKTGVFGEGLFRAFEIKNPGQR